MPRESTRIITLPGGESAFYMEYKGEREHKGRSLVAFLSDYVLIDLETTGLEPSYDEIIEIGAIRVENGKQAATYQTFVKPEYPIDEFITELTGITNEMVADAPSIQDVLPGFLEFIGDSILVGHNVNFDINFLYDNCEDFLNRPFSNDYIDTMRIARRLYPKMQHHRLQDMAEALKVLPSDFHRALADCDTTGQVFSIMREQAVSAYGSIDAFVNSCKPDYYWKPSDIQAEDGAQADPSSPLYGKVCVFTGTLERFTRKQAVQLVVNLGGICGDNVTAKTNFLILGNNDYCKSIKDGKSSKQKKAEGLKLKGKDIEIIPESVFYDMIGLEGE